MHRWIRIVGVVLVGLMLGWGAETVALTSSGGTKHHSSGTSHSSVAKTRVAAKRSSKRVHAARKVSATSSHLRRGARTRLAVRRTRHYYEHFSASSFADNLTLGDVTDGEDPVVRAAAIEALGNMNGTALVIDPSNGRI
ncbi:MAG TPA: penicillin-binding protein, partial [Edaphobacter sp.]|nr:penicillin-binding protein [Edaphobacter sp.]